MLKMLTYRHPFYNQEHNVFTEMKDEIDKFMYPVIDNFVTDDKIRYRFRIWTKRNEQNKITMSMIDGNENISFTIDGKLNKDKPRDVTVSLPYIGKVRLVLFMKFTIPFC